jgi:outer membrane lipoprotein-sorting protein
MQSFNLFSRFVRLFLPICLGVLLVVNSPQPVLSSESEELTDFLKEIQAASDQVRSFSSKFVQERRLALFAEPVIFHGSLTVVRPDRLRWEFTSPIPSVLIFSGDRGMRCNEKAPPVHFDLGSDPVMRTVAEQLWLWLGGDYSRLDSLYLLEKSGTSSLRITPKSEAVSEYIGTVTTGFNKTSRQPEKVEIAEPGGDTTVISFHSYVLNSKTPDILFTVCGTDE